MRPNNNPPLEVRTFRDIDNPKSCLQEAQILALFEFT